VSFYTGFTGSSPTLPRPPAKRNVRKEDAPVATDHSGEEYSLIDQVADGRSGANPERDLIAANWDARSAQALSRLTPRGTHGF